MADSSKLNETSQPAFVNPIDNSEMLWIPPGSFFAGQQAVVNELGFHLARFPITNQQFKKFVLAENYRPTDSEHGIFVTESDSWKDETKFAMIADHPVCFVSVIDAIHYCCWAGVHLPTEWLWEKAARGPEGRAMPWGGTTKQRQWPFPSHLTKINAAATAPVGSYPKTRTPYGCEDLVGNVSEWTLPTEELYSTELPNSLDQWLEYFEPADSTCGVRGCPYMRTNARSLPAAKRRSLAARRRNKWVGFRIAIYDHDGSA